MQSSLGEHLLETGKIQSGEGRAAALAAAAVAYAKALELAAPETDAVSAYNLLCARLLLCGCRHGGASSGDGDNGDGDGDPVAVAGPLDALLEAAAAAAAAESDEGGSTGDAVAELKQELREDTDLESIAAAPFFLALTSA